MDSAVAIDYHDRTWRLPTKRLSVGSKLAYYD